MSLSPMAALLGHLRQWAAGGGDPPHASVVLVLGILAAGEGLAASYFLTLQSPEAETASNAPADKPTTEKVERTDLYGDPLPPGALLRMGTLRFRNREFIGSLAFSPDDKILAAGGYQGKILLYDMATGRKLREIKAATSDVPSLTFAPDGKTLASADLQLIQTWGLATGKEVRRFDSGVKDFSYKDYGQARPPLVFSREGKEVACTAYDHSIRIWNAETGKELAKLPTTEGPVRCLAFSPDRKQLFSAGERAVQIWDIGTAKEVRTLSLPSPNGQGSQKALCFWPDGEALIFSAFATEQRKQGNAILNLVGEKAFLLDLTSGKWRPMLELQEGRFKSAVFSSNAKLLATMNGGPGSTGGSLPEDSNRIQVWETATGKRLFDFTTDADRFQLHGPHLLAFSADGKKLTAATWATSLRVWDLDRGRDHLEKVDAHTDLVQCVTYSPDGRTLATASSDHSIALWDTATGRQRSRLFGHKGPVISVAFSPDGKRLASASTVSEQTVRLWDVTSGKELRRYDVPSEPIGEGQSVAVTTRVAFVANGKILAAAGTDRRIRLWDVSTGKDIRNDTMRGLWLPPRDKANDWYPNRVSCFTLTPDGRMIALFAAKTLSIVDTVAGQALFQFEIKANPVSTVLALSPDGKTLLRGASKAVYFLESASGAELHKAQLPDNVFGAAFSPDGRIVAVSTGENNAQIHLLDVPTGNELLRLRGHESRVRSLTFSPDGTKLASGQWDSTALIWDVSAARHKLPSNDLTMKDLEHLWTDLRDANAAKAHSALWALVAAPDKAVPFLQEHLHPMPRVAAERLHRLVGDLDAEEFARREEASRELAKLASEAESALRKILDGKPSLELRRRVEGLLSEMKCQTEMTPDALRQLRANQVLEQIDSPQAQQILASLGQGAPAAPATRDAAAALQRKRKP